ALTVGALWLNLEASSMYLGLAWGAVGLAYLAYITRFFRKSPPQMEEDAADEMA
ncbi:MAG: Putrescine importer PuuP, partial [Yersiniaceae bacterium]|nr:Putrescine importer PuuP [Yersiniaceae bacterium]